ncbi:site-specific integrase [Anaeromyxobacter sp. SG64]|uniref:tyrosine-type recombinase/integrase n=1 Tax=Anaeromyxobacter sp. SG64 TaxID=2925409 RepID=UPI001F57B0E2|nr:site-specific integrase [Anaeromyxobacter sp. SG64]
MPAPNTTPARGLTPKFIESLQPGETRYDVPDRRAPGLRLRVLPTGRKVFRWVCNARGQVYTIGPWSLSEMPGFVTLAQAREWLDKLKAAHVSGAIDAVEAEIKAAMRPAYVPAAPAATTNVATLGTVAEEFYKRRIMPHRKSPETARRILDLDIIPVLGARPIEALTTRECAVAIERVVDRGAPVHAGKVLALLKQLLRFAEARGYRVGNPAGPLDPKDLGVENNVSDRWLTAEEIVLFWRSLDAEHEATSVERPDPRTGKVQKYEQGYAKLAPATAAALRLLLLTGVRSGELLRAKWAEVDLDAAAWTIPVANQKLTKDQARKAKPFVIPLPSTTVGLLRELQKIAEKHKDAAGKPSPWVVASGQSHDGGYTDKALGRAMRRMFKGEAPRLKLPGGEATPHDLRRTMRTHLGKLRVPLHIVERCLNHSLGRIVQTYDQGDYLDERREALEKWDAYVARLLDPASNVVTLPTAAGGAA